MAILIIPAFRAVIRCATTSFIEKCRTNYRIRRLRLSRLLLVQEARHPSPRIIRTFGTPTLHPYATLHEKPVNMDFGVRDRLRFWHHTLRSAFKLLARPSHG